MPKQLSSFRMRRITVSAQTICTSAIALAQMRKEFTEIPELGTSISQKGLLHAPSYVLLNEQHMKEYLKVINKVYGSRSSTHHFRKYRRPGGTYLVIVAGERRTRGICWAVQNDLPISAELPLNVFVPHGKKPNFEELLEIQIEENGGVQVPKIQEATAIAAYARLLDLQGHDVTYVSVAKRLKRGTALVANAMKFATVPTFVIREVTSGRFSYSQAITLARMVSAGFGDAEVRAMMLRAQVLAGKMSAASFDRKVRTYIEHKRGEDQYEGGSLFGNAEENLASEIYNLAEREIRDEHILKHLDLSVSLSAMLERYRRLMPTQAHQTYQDDEVLRTLDSVLKYAIGVADMVSGSKVLASQDLPMSLRRVRRRLAKV